MSKKRKKHHKIPGSSSTRSALISWYRSKSLVLQFGIKFGALIILLYSLLLIPFFDQILYYYLEANAWLSNNILNSFGENTVVSEVSIKSDQFTMAIRRGCDAVEPTWLFCAAVLSFPAKWSSRVIGIFAGIILLQLLNLIRIVTLYWIGIYFPTTFNSVHMELWPTAFIIVAILLFWGWKEWSDNRVERHAP